jgi:hypothetical protein
MMIVAAKTARSMSGTEENMKTKYATIIAGSLLLLAVACDLRATDTLMPLRCETNGVFIHHGVTSQTIEKAYGTNVMGLAFTGTATYDFYSPPVSTPVNLVTSDKGGGVIYMQNTSTTSANDFSVSGRMQFFDYDPVTGTQTLIVDTTASSAKNVNHGQIVNWAIPNALLPANDTIPAGHLIHIAMTIGLVSGNPSLFGQVLYNGPGGTSTVAYLPQNRSIALNWPISGPMTLPAVSSIGVSGDPAIHLLFRGTPGGYFRIQANTNLCSASSWINIATNICDTNGLCSFIDSQAANLPCRFYRVATP